MASFASSESDSSIDDEFEERRRALLGDEEMLASLGVTGNALATLRAVMGQGEADEDQERESAPGPVPLAAEGAPLQIPTATPTSSVLGSKNADYCLQEYWESRFSDEEEYDWLLSYSDIEPSLSPLLDEYCVVLGKRRDTLNTLIVGCGNSSFSAGLYDAGFTSLTNIDFSSVVIENMAKAHAVDRPAMRWLCMDMLDMTFKNEVFDVVIDKATMDALMVAEVDSWAPSDEVKIKSRQYCSEVSRVMKPRGLFYMISFQQPHFRTKYLADCVGQTSPYSATTGHCASFQWTLEEPSTVRAEKGSLDYFAYTMRAD